MKKLSEQAQAAKLIRKELKQAFPGIKFTVTSKGYSGGDSVSIGWDNGPTYDAVCKVVRKYEYGSFDGMTDSYNYDNVRKDVPQTGSPSHHR